VAELDLLDPQHAISHTIADHRLRGVARSVGGRGWLAENATTATRIFGHGMENNSPSFRTPFDRESCKSATVPVFRYVPLQGDGGGLSKDYRIYIGGRRWCRIVTALMLELRTNFTQDAENAETAE